MHPKLKSTLSGLAAVAAFVLSSVLLGEPLPASGHATGPEAVTPGLDGTSESATLRAQLALDAARANQRRLHLTMPYVSVSLLLPRRQES